MYIKQTVEWIQSMVIGLNLCPFAKREMNNNSARIEASSAQSINDALVDFIGEVNYLQANPAIGTTILIYPHILNDFFAYLDFVDLANDLLVKSGYEGIYQIATFHPDYCFHGVKTDDVTNYTNRSPYPMLHLLREEMLDQAITYYGDTDVIPENNMRCLRELGLVEVRKRLEQCMK
ncbi:DUF1415 domain-containing protein [Legionella saoudiensis]|uniref:DUF1415 domain-containing protein n=1 Tax=Legionella saoudiensis TaxID=1750561 RepID=UPI00072FA9A4|nr:DUF1415 domain-containing protein [Legionella saoudiensis]